MELMQGWINWLSHPMIPLVPASNSKASSLPVSAANSVSVAMASNRDLVMQCLIPLGNHEQPRASSCERPAKKLRWVRMQEDPSEHCWHGWNWFIVTQHLCTDSDSEASASPSRCVAQLALHSIMFTLIIISFAIHLTSQFSLAIFLPWWPGHRRSSSNSSGVQNEGFSMQLLPC